jgi:hypothetical protein
MTSRAGGCVTSNLNEQEPPLNQNDICLKNFDDGHTNSISPSRISITAGRKREVRKPTASLNAFTKRRSTSSIASRSGRFYRPIEELQADLDDWVKEYNEERPPSGTIVLRQDADANIP